MLPRWCRWRASRIAFLTRSGGRRTSFWRATNLLRLPKVQRSPPRFLSKSAKAIENKGIEFFVSAKKYNKVEKSAQEYEKNGNSGWWLRGHKIADSMPPPSPIILHEHQKKRLTEIAIRNRLILMGPVFGCWERARAEHVPPREEKLEPFDRAQGKQSRTLQMKFSIRSIIPVNRRKSRRTLREVRQ